MGIYIYLLLYVSSVLQGYSIDCFIVGKVLHIIIFVDLDSSEVDCAMLSQNHEKSIYVLTSHILTLPFSLPMHIHRPLPSEALELLSPPHLVTATLVIRPRGVAAVGQFR